ncbi:MAG: 23S rRNA (adenine(2503)-C(2))-methyltransferase RlmN [Bacteroidetes bacterium]|nr:23S rRNA (adenine(2503)-C(2))-methyltransferase RlmN [Bacteroidota bacterium]MBU2585081.1 23S rRNA (adenine(2503)-C(2))-methyltransferase RlmN [Bacteroidota bacterium]
MKESKINLKGLTLTELENFFEEINEEKFRAKQMFNWLYHHKVDSFRKITTFTKTLKDRLNKIATIESLKLLDEQTSDNSKTIKYLFECSDGAKIESVLIPEANRLTLCISTQVGCPLDCKFCATGQMGYKRNLSTGEIIDQYLQISRVISEPITNIVYMGMGEPFLNYSNVINSMNIFSSELAFGISGKRVTVSTVGIPDKIKTFAQEPFRGKLAFSLHSVDEQIRSKIMPINKKFPFKQNIDALEYFYKSTKRKITFEYTLLKGINDQESDIKGIVKLSKRIPCKVNIIPFNSIAHTNPSGIAATLKPTSKEEFDFFVERLRSNNVTVFVRNTQGDDIEGACGQLAIKL